MSQYILGIYPDYDGLLVKPCIPDELSEYTVTRKFRGATYHVHVTQTGESSVHDYQCGSPELITIFDALKRVPGVHGARFSGAGYRGCCIGIIVHRIARVR